jgi:opacity protein-like surface antigen
MIRVAAALLITLVASSAWAQAYVGLALGKAKYRDNCLGAASSITCSSSDTAFRLFGGYKINPYLGFELGASTLGTMRASTGESADLDAIDISALVSWPISSRFAVHGRLGIFSGDMTTNPSGGGPVPAAPIFPPPPPQPQPPRVGWSSGNTVGGTYGIGASYAVTPNAVFRLEWQRYEYFGSTYPFGSVGPTTIGVDVVSIGALLSF